MHGGGVGRLVGGTARAGGVASYAVGETVCACIVGFWGVAEAAISIERGLAVLGHCLRFATASRK